MFASSRLSFSISAPFLPMRMPGRAVCTVTRHFLCGRSITTLEMPACLREFKDMLAHLQVFVEKARIFAARGVPARIPGAVDAEPKPDRIDLLSH